MSGWQTRGAAETRALGESLVDELGPSGTLLLYGEMGTGKTVLAQGVASALGIDPAEVQSPTFTLVREHVGSRGRLVHVDLYRLEPHQVPSLGLEELCAGDGVKVIEWAERLPFVPPGALRLALSRLDAERREIQRLNS